MASKLAGRLEDLEPESRRAARRCHAIKRERLDVIGAANVGREGRRGQVMYEKENSYLGPQDLHSRGQRNDVGKLFGNAVRLPTHTYR
jgi:hypothetical protein